MTYSEDMRVEDEGEPRRPFLRVYGAHGNSVVVLTRGKRSGTWQGSIDDPEYDPSPGLEFYWVFVDLGVAPPQCYVCPGSYVAADISRAHAKFLDHHGGGARGNFGTFIRHSTTAAFWSINEFVHDAHWANQMRSIQID